MVIGTGILPYINHVGMHIQSSFYYQQWIGTWRSRFDEETLDDGTAQSVVSEVVPDVDPQREARPQQIVIGNDEAELELSVQSRSFVNRVNDQVRKRQKRISNVTEDGEKHSMIR